MVLIKLRRRINVRCSLDALSLRSRMTNAELTKTSTIKCHIFILGQKPWWKILDPNVWFAEVGMCLYVVGIEITKFVAFNFAEKNYFILSLCTFYK